MTDETESRTSPGAVALVAAMSQFLVPFTGSSVNIALPTISGELHLTAISLNWVATAYLLSAAAFLVPFGRLSDIHGRKRVYFIGTVISAGASLLCALAPSGAWLLGGRVLQGMGSAMVFGTVVAILTSVYPAHKRGHVLGINVAAVYAGLSTGPLFGGFIIGWLGWRSIFGLNAVLNLIIVTIIFWKVRGEWTETAGEKFDAAGSILYCLALGLLMYGVSRLPGTAGGLMISAGIIGLAGFIFLEINLKNPVLQIGLFRKNTVFAFSNLAALINYSAVYAVGFTMSLYLQYIKGFDPQHAGLILVVQPVMQVIVSPIAGDLSDRMEPRVVASLGMGLTTAGLLLLSFLSPQTSLAYVVGSLIVLGIGFGLFSSPNTNAVMSSVEKRNYGIASGMLGTMRLVGQATSMGIVLLLLSIHVGRVQLTPQYYGLFMTTLRSAFTISAVLCFGGIFASVARGPAHVKPAGHPPPLI